MDGIASKVNNSNMQTKINSNKIRYVHVRKAIDHDFACFVIELSMVCHSEA